MNTTADFRIADTTEIVEAGLEAADVLFGTQANPWGGVDIVRPGHAYFARITVDDTQIVVNIIEATRAQLCASTFRFDGSHELATTAAASAIISLLA